MEVINDLTMFFVFLPLVMLFVPIIYGLSELVEILVEKAVDRARVDEVFKNNMLSGFYFIIEMGPNVSATSIVAIFIGGIDTVFQLVAVFIFGILMKEYGRRSRDLFMDAVRAGGTTWE